MLRPSKMLSSQQWIHGSRGREKVRWTSLQCFNPNRLEGLLRTLMVKLAWLWVTAILMEMLSPFGFPPNGFSDLKKDPKKLCVKSALALQSSEIRCRELFHSTYRPHLPYMLPKQIEFYSLRLGAVIGKLSKMANF